jgi:transcriptional regulator with XRE-family HTH domain
MSQTVLAERVGITFQQVQKYERGTNQLAASRLYGFAQALEVPVDYFFQDVDPPVEDTHALPSPYPESPYKEFTGSDDVTRRETLELARAFQSIEETEIRRELITLANVIADTLLTDSDKS